MNIREYKKLKLGLYRIWWCDGGNSLASIGMQSDGTKWIAPINWVEPSLKESICYSIKKVSLLK